MKAFHHAWGHLFDEAFQLLEIISSFSVFLENPFQLPGTLETIDIFSHTSTLS
jgi:hypothetical protein